jgi:biotin carboxylase
MATLLMVESWLRSTGLCLPPIIRRLGHEYVLFTKDPALYTPVEDGRPHPVIRDAAEIGVVDTNDTDTVLDAAAELANRRPIDGVLTTCDYYLETVATVARLLGLPSARPDVMHRATQKHLVRARLEEAGLPNPAFDVVADWHGARVATDRIGRPVIAKPVDLNAGTGVELISNEADLKDAFWRVAGMERNTRGQPLRRLLLLEERLEGQEVSVEAVTYRGQTEIIGITDKSIVGQPACVESGHMFPARLDRAVVAEIETFVVEALAAIGYDHGLSHTEVMITADGPRVVEINPRQAGGYIFDLIHLVVGVHPLEMLVELALGNRPVIRGVQSSGSRPASAAVFFVTSPREGIVEHISGIDGLDAEPRVHRWTRPTPATRPAESYSVVETDKTTPRLWKNASNVPCSTRS